jgi:hypothetical protein
VPEEFEDKNMPCFAPKEPPKRFIRAKKALLDFGMPFGLTETRKDQ